MKRILPILLFLPILCFGQGAHRLGQVLVKGNNVSANVGPYANIKVCVVNTNCQQLATIYSDPSMGVQTTNPVIADGNGNYSYYIPTSCVDEQISTPGQGLVLVPHVCPFNGQSGGGSSNINPTPQHRIFQQPDPGTQQIAGPTNITTDDSGNNITIPGSAKSPLVNRIFNAYGYGAVPDGTVCPTTFGSLCTYSGTDSTAAIQSAINDACSAGGGEVDIPGGTYNIASTAGAPRQIGNVTTNVAALTLPCNNITIRGSGKGVTILSYWMITGGQHMRITDTCPANPDFTPDKSYYTFPRTWRGSLFYITGSFDAANPRTGVVIDNLTLEGNAIINGNNTNPVRRDSTASGPSNPLPIYSQCNDWDTSNKGIYLQNNYFDPTTHPITDGAYYPPAPVYFGDITVSNVAIDHVLGEEMYSGNDVKNFVSTNNTLTYTNGDGISVSGGQYITGNVINNCHGNGMENPTTEYKVLITGNTVSDCYTGINLFGADYMQQNPTYPSISITNNTVQNIVGQGIFLTDPINVQVKHNNLQDCAWRGATSDSASCINLFANLGSRSVTWGPAGPSSTTATPGAASSGTIPAGIYSYAVTWFTLKNEVWGQTAGTCTTVTIPANGSVTINAPSDTPPDEAIGWFAYAIQGSTCDLSHLPTLQIVDWTSGFNSYPLTQTSAVLTAYVAAGDHSPPMPWPNPSGGTPNGFVIYAANPTNVDVQNNYITSNIASVSTGVGGFGAPNGITPIWARGINVTNNKSYHLGSHAKTAHAAPTDAPVLQAITGPQYGFPSQPDLPAGTYYVQTTELWPACETKPSPEATITVSAGQQINVTPPDLHGAPFYKVYMSTTSGQEVIQDNIGPSVTMAGNVYTQQYFLRTFGGGFVHPPTTDCTGTTFKAGTGFPSGFNVSGNSLHARNTTIHNNESTDTLADNVANQSVIGKVITDVGTPVPVVTFRPATEGPVQVSFAYKVSNAATTVNAYFQWRAPDGAIPAYALTAPELATGSGQAVNGTWYTVNVPDFVISTGLDATIFIVVGTANNVTVNASISSKGMIQ